MSLKLLLDLLNAVLDLPDLIGSADLLLLDAVGDIVELVVGAHVLGSDLSHILVQGVELPVEHLGNLVDSSLDVLLHGRQDTTPAFISLLIGLHVDEECVEVILVVHESEVIAEDLNLLLEGGLLSHLGDLGIGVSHDGNQHVEDDDLGDEGGEEEDDPHDDHVASLIIVVNGELSQQKQILVQSHVDNRV
jgi:hypothetical protein